MKKPGKLEVLQGVSCLLCAVVVWREIGVLGPSEFSGGYVSGPLFWIANVACFLFLLGLVLTFVFRRAAAALLITATLFCWPLYLYLMFPGVARKITGGEYSTPLLANVIWDRWLIAGMLCLLGMAYVCGHDLSATSRTASS
jgi:hypothetical protein